MKPPTETLGSYRIHRNRAIAWALDHIKPGFFTWQEFAEWVKDYEKCHYISIETPRELVSESPLLYCGGWPFIRYDRIYLALQRLVEKGKLETCKNGHKPRLYCKI